MKFYWKGKTYDTDKHVYVAGYMYDRKSNWIPFDRENIKNYPGFIIKCKEGTINRLYIDYNHGQSFVSGFDINVPSYYHRLDSNKVIFAESPIKARQLYEDIARGKIG